MSPARMPSPAPKQKVRPSPRARDSFWFFVRWMLRYWGLCLAAFGAVIVSAITLGAGLLGAQPVMANILGAKKDLPAFATDFNQALAKDWPVLSFLSIPQGVIDALPHGPFTALVLIMSGLAVLTVIGSIANFMHAYLSLTAVNRTVTAARRQAFHRVLRAPLRAIVQGGPSDAISRIVNDSSQVAGGLNVLMSKAVLQVFKGVASLITALVFDWRVTAGALVVAPALYTVIRKLGKRIKRYSGAALESQAGLYAAAAEALQGLKVVKVHTTEPYEIGRFHRINKKMLRELNRVRTARALASPLTEMLSIFLLCGLVLAAGNAIIKQNVSASDFIMVIACLAVAGASLKPLTGIINDVQTASPAAERLKNLLEVEIEPGHERSLPRLAPHAQSLELRDVVFTYPGAASPALRGVSLRVAHGERVALVGPNGSGKTTLLGLVPRLFDVDQGSVLIDGVDVRSVGVRSLRGQIGMVTQETVLFRGTIRENIAYGSAWASQADIERAAMRARAHEFIMALPQGYESSVAEQGATLSGGQRQRIAIARAVLRNPRILILDEATSMVDAESEASIAAAMAEFTQGRTCLIVAHRLSTVQHCDRIVVLDRGQIVDQGTHGELLGRCGLYQQLARAQLLDVGV